MNKNDKLIPQPNINNQIAIENLIKKNENTIFKSATNFFNIGMVHFRKKELSLARTNFSTAIEIDSKYVKAYFYRGYANSEFGNYNEAIADFKNALNLNNKHVPSLYHISYIYCTLKLYDQALYAISKVIDIDPDWHSLMQRASINRCLNKIKEAEIDEIKAWEMGHDFNV